MNQHCSYIYAVPFPACLACRATSKSVCGAGSPIIAAFSGLCARTSGLALCPYRPAEGCEVLQCVRGCFLGRRIKFCELDRVVVGVKSG